MQFLLLKCCNTLQHEQVKKIYDHWQDHGVLFLSCTGRGRRFHAIQTTGLVSEIHFECKQNVFFQTSRNSAQHLNDTLPANCCRLDPSIIPFVVVFFSFWASVFTFALKTFWYRSMGSIWNFSPALSPLLPFSYASFSLRSLSSLSVWHLFEIMLRSFAKPGAEFKPSSCV